MASSLCMSAYEPGSPVLSPASSRCPQAAVTWLHSRSPSKRKDQLLSSPVTNGCLLHA